MREKKEIETGKNLKFFYRKRKKKNSDRYEKAFKNKFILISKQP